MVNLQSLDGFVNRDEKESVMVQSKRLGELFSDLVQTDSESTCEAAFAAKLKPLLIELGAVVQEDRAGEKTGSETGNLVARFPGTVDAPSLMFAAHMDTVSPGRGIRVHFHDGVFTSAGDTILGADDKSAIAILIEAMRVLQESDLPHAPLELVFTICEEIGLLGARNLEPEMVRSRMGYALDTTSTTSIITRAPAINHLKIVVHGRDAHAGIAPEKGINAIHVAATAISRLAIGKIDDLTSCNIGLIDGGKAANIVPNRVEIKGEVRSHDPKRLSSVSDAILGTFRETAADIRRQLGEKTLPRVDTLCTKEFPNSHIPEDHPVVLLAQEAAANLGRKLAPAVTGGAADANIFFDRGIMTAVLGTGMQDIHSTRESIALEDMVRTTELVLEIIRLHSHSPDTSRY
jgi:tripeptide aminopeptidase